MSVLKRKFGNDVGDKLKAMELEGRVVRLRRHYYAHAGYTKHRVGVFRVKGKKGTVFVDDRGLVIPVKKALGAMDGDTVVVLPERGESARVVRVLRRARSVIPGFMVKEENSVLFRPYRRKLPDFIPRKADPIIPDGNTAYRGTIASYPTTGRRGRVEPEDPIGSFGEKEMEARVVYVDRGWNLPFPEQVREEAVGVAASGEPTDMEEREDLRDRKIFTIDGEYARDFDDAISLERAGPEKWLLGVHIADVSHYVRPGTALDEEAYERATSTYFPDVVVPMLPESLSNGVCSLRPDEDRLTLSVFMSVDEGGRVSRPKVRKSVIRSRYRMTYTKVQEILDGALRHPLKNTLVEMDRLAKKFLRKRVNKGSLDFDLPEVGIIYDDSGRMVGVRPEIRLSSHRLIEEFMIAANQTVARLLASRKIPFLYRIHEEPDRGKLYEMKMILEGLGYPFRVNLDEIQPTHIQKLMESWEGKPEEPYLHELLLRSLARAKYTPDNMGHFGLALEHYCHFTSPIRRYPDLVVHRQVKNMLQNIRYDESEHLQLTDRMEEMGEHCSEREWEAEDAEREVMEWKTLQIVKEKEGKILPGKISGVIETGIFINLTDYQVQGFIPFAAYTGDYLSASTLQQSVTGRRTDVSFRLGDEVRVRVLSVDLHKRYLRLEVQ